MRAVIIGCGYVGRVLGSILLAGGHDVTGVARSDSSLTAIRRRGITPREADVTTPETIDALPDADWVIVAVSSGGGDAAAAQAVFQEGLATVIDSYADRGDPPDRIIYTSSSSVYGDRGGRWVDETDAPDPQTSKTTILARAEEVAVEQSGVSGIDGTVCRFAGLYGPDRYRLDRYLDETVTTGYLNLVHRVDAAGAIAHLLRAGRGRGEVINIVDDAPTDRYHLAFTLAQMAGVAPRIVACWLTDSQIRPCLRRVVVGSQHKSVCRTRSCGHSATGCDTPPSDRGMPPQSHSAFEPESAHLSPLQITRITPADAVWQVLRIERPQPCTTGSAVQAAKGVTGDGTTADRASYAVHVDSLASIDINTGGLFAVAAKAAHGVHAAVGRDAARFRGSDRRGPPREGDRRRPDDRPGGDDPTDRARLADTRAAEPRWSRDSLAVRVGRTRGHSRLVAPVRSAADTAVV